MSVTSPRRECRVSKQFGATRLSDHNFSGQKRHLVALFCLNYRFFVPKFKIRNQCVTPKLSHLLDTQAQVLPEISTGIARKALASELKPSDCGLLAFLAHEVRMMTKQVREINKI